MKAEIIAYLSLLRPILDKQKHCKIQLTKSFLNKLKPSKTDQIDPNLKKFE